MAQLVFFYGTLMTPFNRPGRRRIEDHLTFRGRGRIAAALFDLGMYPAAVPASDARVLGEVYEMTNPGLVLHTLDEIEGYRPDAPDAGLYTRLPASVTLEDGAHVDAWAYFYTGPLGRAARIASGDYLGYLKGR